MPPEPGPRARSRRRRSLRTRVTISASLITAAAITGGVVLLYLLQMHAVRQTVDGQLRTYAAQIAQASPTGNWPRPLPRSSLDPAAEAQVIAADGTVLTSTRGLAGVPATFALPAGSTRPVRLKGADGVIPDDVGVFALREIVNGQPVTIVAGTPTGLLRSINTEFTYRLIAGFPITLALAAAAVWTLVGRALAPVEQIRRAVTDITSADLSRRVPEPGTIDEIGHLAETMNEMLARLEDSALRQRRFVADASHELRSPLATLRTTLDVALAHPDRAPWPAVATRAAGQTARLERLIQDLLRLAKADEHPQVGHRQTLDAADLLRDVVGATPARGLTVDLHLADGVFLHGDRADLGRLVRNLLDNAVRYAASTVTVTLAATPGTARIHVLDDGPGVPAADRERVFDRFVRLDASRDRASGNSGLGLAIAREIASAHQGWVWAADPPKSGAHLIIELPRLTGH
ncbi:HAMP domain-containing protein [Sphaerisporangium album]|uniref:histidine kinase n=1 Tax=Sphaerisporangium album TaxID=509200 RepID=A0A367FNZ1_9ACTN|nr:ATP-binding protein [Sphaerisporangium album]RCG31400.1 HAMP domain-containing protein [Sphaerisporangium album]